MEVEALQGTRDPARARARHPDAVHRRGLRDPRAVGDPQRAPARDRTTATSAPARPRRRARPGDMPEARLDAGSLTVARHDRTPPPADDAAPPTFRHFIAGEWCDGVSRRDVREPQPGRHPRRRSAGSRPGTPADVAMAIKAAETAWPMWSADARPEARRDPVPLRRADGRAQGAALPGDEPRDGQGHRRGPGRRPGGHRHRLPDGRRGPPDVRRHRAVRAARQVGDEHPPADRRRRDHHALELPDRDSVLEDDAGARHRQHRRLQAGQRHAALRDARSWS